MNKNTEIIKRAIRQHLSPNLERIQTPSQRLGIREYIPGNTPKINKRKENRMKQMFQMFKLEVPETKPWFTITLVYPENISNYRNFGWRQTKRSALKVALRKQQRHLSELKDRIRVVKLKIKLVRGAK